MVWLMIMIMVFDGNDGIAFDNQGCESSDFNLISDFLALHKTPFSDF